MTDDQLLCLWCGELFRPRPESWQSGRGSKTLHEYSKSSYCRRGHSEKARQRRRDRRTWKYDGCSAPHAPTERDRGMAIARAREGGGEVLTCKCGSYHVVAAGEGGQSPELDSVHQQQRTPGLRPPR